MLTLEVTRRLLSNKRNFHIERFHGHFKNCITSTFLAFLVWPWNCSIWKLTCSYMAGCSECMGLIPKCLARCEWKDTNSVIVVSGPLFGISIWQLHICKLMTIQNLYNYLYIRFTLIYTIDSSWNIICFWNFSVWLWYFTYTYASLGFLFHVHLML